MSLTFGNGKTMAQTNFYAGACSTCGAPVAKYAGIYYAGDVFCTQPVLAFDFVADRNFFVCEVDADRAAKYWASPEGQAAKAAAESERAAKLETYRLINIQEVQRLAEAANVRSVAQVIEKVTGQTVALEDLTTAQGAQVIAELHRRISRKHNKDRRTIHEINDTCPRCGGAGRADKWIHTGSTCYDCNGDGKYHARKAN